MRFDITYSHAKTMATRLQTYLEDSPKKLSRSSAIEAVAKMLGYNNRNEMAARIDAQEDAAPKQPPVTIADYERIIEEVRTWRNDRPMTGEECYNTIRMLLSEAGQQPVAEASALPSLSALRAEAAEKEVMNYEFYRTLTDNSNWGYVAGEDEWSCTLYLEDPEDLAGEALRGNFTVVFEPGSAKVITAKASLDGYDIGYRPEDRKTSNRGALQNSEDGIHPSVGVSVVNAPSLEEARSEAADVEFNEYDFDESLVDYNGWEYVTGQDEISRVVFFESFEDPNGASMRGHFTVVFKPGTAEVVSAYASLNGEDVGRRTRNRKMPSPVSDEQNSVNSDFLNNDPKSEKLRNEEIEKVATFICAQALNVARGKSFKDAVHSEISEGGMHVLHHIEETISRGLATNTDLSMRLALAFEGLEMAGAKDEGFKDPFRKLARVIVNHSLDRAEVLWNDSPF